MPLPDGGGAQGRLLLRGSPSSWRRLAGSAANGPRRRSGSCGRSSSSSTPRPTSPSPKAISIKQNMLIEYALRPGMSNGEISDDKIRVFSSTVNDIVNGAESTNTHPKSVDKESFELRNEAHSSMACHHEQSAFQIADGFSSLDDPDPANSIKNPSAYDGFLEHIDLQIKSLEYEIEQFISSQSVEEVGSEEQRNDKWQRLSDIHMLVKETRERIARILDMTVNETESGDLR
ncbi:hypothetical protein GQ55_5G194500 [Panicum hallii var. hallii]|uniref:Uncharacterized protein n=1 Tax=Panicum hallii var. hallii TaxID=1504633 RepID=A0A2T7DI16_9POAL|nr:hypothetical protein GQ55_5G194500 [Panicum hallii var. hallii]